MVFEGPILQFMMYGTLQCAHNINKVFSILDKHQHFNLSSNVTKLLYKRCVHFMVNMLWREKTLQIANTKT